VHGIPRDIGAAQALFRHSPFDFERWAVSLINGQPNEKQVGDKGIDGVARFYLDKATIGRLLVSVKGGKTVTPQFVRDLIGTIQTQKAQMGVLITMAEPTRGMLDALDPRRHLHMALNNQSYPRVQVGCTSILWGIKIIFVILQVREVRLSACCTQTKARPSVALPHYIAARGADMPL
jgi:hypothetical protein